MSDREMDTNRPYAPPSNINMFLERIRTRNLPDRVDRDYLIDSGISETLVSRVSFALRFLGLLEGEVPTPALRAISVSTDEEYREILTERLHEGYADVFAVVDPSRDSASQILNVFRRFTPGSQRERMVSFFLAMCKEAGIEVLDAPRERARESGTSSRAKSRPTPVNSKSRDKSATLPGPSLTPAAVRLAVGLAPALEMLVQSLPPPGSALPSNKREQWLRMAEATLEFLYPETEVSENTEIQMDG